MVARELNAPGRGDQAAGLCPTERGRQAARPRVPNTRLWPPRRGRAQRRRLPRRARRHNGPAGAPARCCNPGPGAGAAEGADLRAERPADVAEPHATARPGLPLLRDPRSDRGRVRHLPGYEHAGGRRRGRRARPRPGCSPRRSLSPGPGPASGTARTRSPSARSRSSSPNSPRSGTSCSRPSRRDSSSSWSSGSTCRRTRWRCGSERRGSRA